MPSAMISTIVLVEGKAWSRTAILNRPSVLNALNTAVGARLQKLYKSWEDNPNIGFVVLKGRGRAFCAGGDIVALCHLINEGNIEDCKEIFRTLYSFIYLLGVALLNGITMGGGAGFSVPGTFKVATDKTVFATPETLIGFHPDAGASFYFSHLPGHLGEYLALTGDKLNGVELISCGLATHYSISAVSSAGPFALLLQLPLIEEQLGKLVTDDPSVVETSLAKYGDIVYPDRASVLHRIETLDKCFSHDTVEEIINALESEAAKTHDDWCTSTLKKLQHCSPLSLKVSLRSCLGLWARVVDKDMAPKWNPPNLEQVSEDMVDQYFSPLSEFEPDLELPIKQRKTFT
ncbi:unnamed protein product [Camellia sinensis]